MVLETAWQPVRARLATRVDKMSFFITALTCVGGLMFGFLSFQSLYKVKILDSILGLDLDLQEKALSKYEKIFFKYEKIIVI